MALESEVQDINWSEAFEVSAPHIKTESSNPQIKSETPSIPDDCIKCLLDSFGHSHFREMQWKIISSILYDARDNCVIMATGSGKSLCFQFPSVYRNTITIVVSPLISLMQDQVTAMCFYKLKACFLGSAQTNRDTVYEVIDRQYNIVYVTPEYITSESGEFLIKRILNDLTLIAIDEAHCISKWGHDFRLAYRNLSNLRSLCPSVPILAMTATATEKVCNDIIHSLRLKNPQVISTGFDRPNLEFVVKTKSTVWEDIGQHIRNVKIGSIIVYCISRRVTEEVATEITAHGQPCGVYHAGLSLKQRRKTHDEFIHDRIRVVVATIAFGMGINKPDVRLVIHYGVSKDIEGYYQEVGRAGRDGLPAKCLLFHRTKDWALHRIIRQASHPFTSHEEMEQIMKPIRNYVDTKECRRSFILSYFGEDCTKAVQRSDCCDNCSRNMAGPVQPINLYSKYQGLDMDGRLDITEETKLLLKLLQDMKCFYGLRKAILVLRGSRAKEVPSAFSKHSKFGKLKHRSDKWMQAVANSLVEMNMLTLEDVHQAKFIFTRCLLTNKAKVWLSGIVEQVPIKIVPNDEFIKLLSPRVVSAPKIVFPIFQKKPEDHAPAESSVPLPPSSTSSSVPSKTVRLPSPSAKSDILRPLLKVRSKLASLFDVMPYLVASTKALEQLAKIQPTSMEELRRIRLDGYSEEKTQRFGPVFIKVIKDYQAKFRKTDIVEQHGMSDQENQPPVKIKVEPTTEASKTIPTPNSHEDTESLNTDHQTKGSSQSENGNSSLSSTQESLELIEPLPKPVIEIESDIENAIFANWDSDDSELTHLGNEIDSKLGVNKQSKCENTDLDLLIDALASEDLTQKKSEDVKQPRTLTKNKASNELEYKSDSESDIFDADWDLEIDESDLTQISQQVEEQLKCDSERLTASTSTGFSSELLQPKSIAQIGVRNGTPGQSQCTKEEKKHRIIQRKVSNAFEYEDSDSETDTKPIVSPKKRSLPSWMQLSQKKKR